MYQLRRYEMSFATAKEIKLLYHSVSNIFTDVLMYLIVLTIVFLYESKFFVVSIFDHMLI